MIELHNLTKIYNEDLENQVIALDHVSFTLPESGMVFLLGKSGSGKTTMLNLLGGLDAPTEGELRIDGTSSKNFRQKDWDAYRNNYVGFVFQEYNLLDDLTIGANITLALNLQGKMSKAEAEQKISAVLEQVGLSGYGNRKPSELSGGQKQRIAIARALVKNPQMILADEPTGALDSENGKQIFDLLKEISAEKLVVVVSHDEEAARRYADRIVQLSDGKVISDSTSSNASKITYRSNAVHIPANYRFSDEEWADVKAYMEACLRGETPELPTVQADLTNESPRNHFQSSLAAMRNNLALKNANLPLSSSIKIGVAGMHRSRTRLFFTIILCTISFFLTGISDMLSAYNYRQTLINSLYEQQPTYITISKEMYNNYNYTEPGLLLPSQEAVDWFARSAIEVRGGRSDWQQGYMFTDADLEQLTQRTELNFKGVYTPSLQSLSFINMQVEKNYARPNIEALAKVYVEELTGFVEFTKGDLLSFNYSMLAGRLPEAPGTEIAISKYLYLCFVEMGYVPYSGPSIVIQYFNKKNGYFLTEDVISWDDFVGKSETHWKKINRTSEELEVAFGCPVEMSINIGGNALGSEKIVTPEDLLGKSLFLAGRNFTITGIIDTGFNAELYDPGYYTEIYEKQKSEYSLLPDQMALEYNSGVACLGFVSPGTIQLLSCNQPTVIFMDDFNLTLENDTDHINITGLVRASDLKNFFGHSNTWDDGGEGWIGPSAEALHNDDSQIYLCYAYSNAYSWLCDHADSGTGTLSSLASNAKITVTGHGNRASYFGYTFSLSPFNWILDVQTPDGRYMTTQIGYMPSEFSFVDANFEDLRWYAAVSDHIFDLFTEGRAGTYTYAIGPNPKSRDAISVLVDGCMDEIDNVRYPIGGPVAYQLNSLDTLLNRGSTLFRYASVLLLLFAIALVSLFVSNSIRQRKREIGILRALGVTNFDIVTIFFTEIFLLAFFNAILTILSVLIISLIGNAVLQNNLDLILTLFNFSLRQVSIIVALSFGIAFVASIIPILRIARKKPIDAIRE